MGEEIVCLASDKLVVLAHIACADNAVKENVNEIISLYLAQSLEKLIVGNAASEILIA